jgi:hypothetical protein
MEDHTHAYREGIGKQALEAGFLCGSSAPPRLDEDTLAVMAMIAVVAAGLGRTCETSDRRFSPINVVITPIPSFRPKVIGTMSNVGHRL